MFASALGTYAAGWTAGGTQYFVTLIPGANADLRQRGHDAPLPATVYGSVSATSSAVPGLPIDTTMY